MEASEPRVYVRHLRACGFCLIPGGRDWFKQHGLSWRDFLRNGIAVSALSGIDDALMRRVVDKALEEHRSKQ